MSKASKAASAVKVSESKDKGDKGGGKVNPIYVTDKNDPKLKAYNDSLSLYNKGLLDKKEFFKLLDTMPDLDRTKMSSAPPNRTSGKIQPISQVFLDDAGSDPTIKGNRKYKTIYDNMWRSAPPDDPLSKGYLEYAKPKQKVILQKEELKPIESKKINIDIDTDIKDQPKKPTRVPIIKEALRKIVNPDFRDSDYTEKHNSVVDALGNPKYKYYNKDKVIGEKEYKKLKANEQSK